jgi:AcrR family transcriptional regulator
MPKRRLPAREPAGLSRDGKQETRPALNREAVVNAALLLLDEAGLDGLSMRNLADRLGIRAASLYWYLHDKQELLELVADTISRDAQAPDPRAPWRSQLEAFEREYRRVLLAHPDAAYVFARTVPAGPHRLRLVDLALAALLAAGFRGLDALRAGRLLADYVESFVQEEALEARLLSELGSAGPGAEDRLADLGRQFVEAPADTYPSIAALALYLPDLDNDARFEFGLRVVLDGLERAVSPVSDQKSNVPAARDCDEEDRHSR